MAETFCISCVTSNVDSNEIPCSNLSNVMCHYLLDCRNKDNGKCPFCHNIECVQCEIIAIHGSNGRKCANGEGCRKRALKRCTYCHWNECTSCKVTTVVVLPGCRSGGKMCRKGNKCSKSNCTFCHNPECPTCEKFLPSESPSVDKSIKSVGKCRPGGKMCWKLTAEKNGCTNSECTFCHDWCCLICTKPPTKESKKINVNILKK